MKPDETVDGIDTSINRTLADDSGCFIRTIHIFLRWTSGEVLRHVDGDELVHLVNSPTGKGGKDCSSGYVLPVEYRVQSL